MKKLFIILLSVLSLAASAQQKKVAVYVTGVQTDVTKILGDQLVSAFTRSGNYIAVERTNSFLAEISREQNYQRTGAVSDKEIARLGDQLGVQYVCVVDISEAFGKKYVSTRLLNVVSAEVVSTANATTSLNSMDELIRVADTLKDQLLNGASQATVPHGYVDLGLPSGTLWQKQSGISRLPYQEAIQGNKALGASIPTSQQWMELLNHCIWTLKSNGYEVTSRNGNSIMLRFNDGGTGCYWSSTKPYGSNNQVYNLFFNNREQIMVKRWTDTDTPYGAVTVIQQ